MSCATSWSVSLGKAVAHGVTMPTATEDGGGDGAATGLAARRAAEADRGAGGGADAAVPGGEASGADTRANSG
jgi:hypothetical protein